MLRASYALVQATVGVGTVIVVYIGVAYTRRGGGGTDSSLPTQSVSSWFGSLCPRKYNPIQQQKSCGSRCCFPQRDAAQTCFYPPPSQHPPTGNTPDKKAADAAPLPQTIGPKPSTTSTDTPAHPTQRIYRPLHPHTLHLQICVVLPQPHVRVPVHNASKLKSVGPNPHAAPVLGYGIREWLAPVCAIHRECDARSAHAATLVSYKGKVLP